MSDFLWALVGLVICVIIFTIVCILIMCVVWVAFRSGQDFEIEFEDWEE